MQMFPKLRDTSDPGRRDWKVQDAQLKEHSSLIPIEMLAGHFAALNLNNNRQGKFNRSPSGRYTGNHPIHSECVRETNDHLVDNPIDAEDLRNITEFEIRRDIREELIRIERINTRPTVPARSGRNKDHVGILSHRSKGSIGIFEYELSVGVLLPCSEHQPLVGREITHRNSLQFTSEALRLD